MSKVRNNTSKLIWHLCLLIDKQTVLPTIAFDTKRERGKVKWLQAFNFSSAQWHR
jgi:hypothetical protein